MHDLFWDDYKWFVLSELTKSSTVTRHTWQSVVKDFDCIRHWNVSQKLLLHWLLMSSSLGWLYTNKNLPSCMYVWYATMHGIYSRIFFTNFVKITGCHLNLGMLTAWQYDAMYFNRPTMAADETFVMIGSCSSYIWRATSTCTAATHDRQTVSDLLSVTVDDDIYTVDIWNKASYTDDSIADTMLCVEPSWVELS